MFFVFCFFLPKKASSAFLPRMRTGGCVVMAVTFGTFGGGVVDLINGIPFHLSLTSLLGFLEYGTPIWKQSGLRIEIVGDIVPVSPKQTIDRGIQLRSIVTHSRSANAVTGEPSKKKMLSAQTPQSRYFVGTILSLQ